MYDRLLVNLASFPSPAVRVRYTRQSDGQDYNAVSGAFEAWSDANYASYQLAPARKGTTDEWGIVRPAVVAAAGAVYATWINHVDGTLANDVVMADGAQDAPASAVATDGSAYTVGGYAVGQDPATLLLTNPTYKLTTDANGRIGVNNFPVEFLSSAEQTELTTSINDLNALLGRTDTAGTVGTISGNVATLLTRISGVLSIANGKVAATVAASDGTDAHSILTMLGTAGSGLTGLPTVTVSGFTAGAITSAAFATGALNGKGDWLLGSAYTPPPVTVKLDPTDSTAARVNKALPNAAPGTAGGMPLLRNS